MIYNVTEKKAMKRANIFPTLNKEILPLLVINPSGPVPQEVDDLSSTNTHRDEIVTLGGSTMRGRGIDQSSAETFPPLKEILTKLVKCLKERFDNIISDRTASYTNETPTEIYNAAMIVVERFDDLLMANGFKLECLRTLKQEIFAASKFHGFAVEV